MIFCHVALENKTISSSGIITPSTEDQHSTKMQDSRYSLSTVHIGLKTELITRFKSWACRFSCDKPV